MQRDYFAERGWHLSTTVALSGACVQQRAVATLTGKALFSLATGSTCFAYVEAVSVL
jgi:hypothetical protein